MKKIKFLALSLLAILFLTSCGGDKEPTTPTKDETILLPYLEVGKTKDDIKTFENQRGSKLTSETDSELVFDTKSTVITKIKYSFVSGGKYKDAVTYFAGADVASKNLDKLKTDLRQQGFTEKGSEYYHAKRKTTVYFTTIAVKYVGEIEVEVVVDDKPTFSEFPKFITDFGIERPALENWEGQNAGTFNGELSSIPMKNEQGIELPADFLTFSVSKSERKTNPELPTFRRYIIVHRDYEKQMDDGTVIAHKKGLRVNIHFNNNPAKVFYITNNGEAKVTKAYKALAKKEGFTYTGLGTTPRDKRLGFHYFENKEKNLLHLVYLRKDDQGKDFLVLEMKEIVETAKK